jgi:hypothetical protein
VFIAGLSFLTPTVTHEAELEGRENACPAGGELQGGQCVVEPQVSCPDGYEPLGGGEGEGGEEDAIECGRLIAQETPVCPEGSTDLDEREDRFACSDDVTGADIDPVCATEGARLTFSDEGLRICNIYEFTAERTIGGCEGEGFTMNEDGQCVSRPGRMPTLPE